MSESEDMVDGVTCQECGEYFDDILNGAEAPGYPRTCEICLRTENEFAGFDGGDE